MNKRIVSMLHTLCDTGKEICISDLAEQYRISQRTVRNDLASVNEILKENCLAELHLGKGGRILRETDFQQVLGCIDEKDFYDYKLSREERKKIASVLLVTADGFITLSDLADHMAVSRATVIHDLDEIKSYIGKSGLKVTSHPNKGLRVEGNESDKRIFLLSLVNYNPNAAGEDVVQTQISTDEEKALMLEKILTEQEHKHQCFLNDSSFQKIRVYMGIMIRRIEQGCYIEERKKNENSKQAMASDLLKYTAQYCGIQQTPEEIQFLSEILSFGKYIKQKSSDPDSVKIQMVTRQFIEDISAALDINLTQDYDFFENLSRHLESTLSVRVSMPEVTAVVEKVLEENPEILHVVKSNLASIEEYAERGISEIEAEYIAVHVLAAIERKKNQSISMKVIVACHAGIGTSRLLLEKLKKNFRFQVVDIVSAHEAGNLSSDQANLVISTVPLKKCPIEWIQVTPLLKDEDYIRIGNKIDEWKNILLNQEKREVSDKSSRELVDEIGEILYNKVPDEAGELIRDIEKAIRGFLGEDAEIDEDIYSPQLYQMLPPSHIFLDVKAEDWQQAVRISAEKLLKDKYIEPRYVEAMIKNIRENGPYVVLTKGFALPHEGIDQGVFKTGMNLIRLNPPVEFEAEENDPVEFVCCMCTTDHKVHMRAFFNLINMLRNPEFLKELRESSTPEEAAKIIRAYEKTVDK